jgi:glycosyltransferase involved in cell wall biosynthesis
MRSLTIGRQRPIFYPLGLRRVVEENGASAIIVAGTGSLAIAAAGVARKTDAPLLIWSGEIKQGSRFASLKRPIKRWLLEQTRAIICYGTATATYLSELAPEKPLFKAWNTSDLEPFLALTRDPSSTDTAKVRLISVGDLEVRKGYHLLLQAMANTSSDVIARLDLRIIGDGSQRDDLRLLANSLGLAAQVEFMGSRPARAIPPFLATGDVFVFPTLRDVWGLALVEGIAAGLPVIASTRAGATQDIVLPGAGVAVDPMNIDSMTDAVNSLAELTAKERYEMGQRGRAHVAHLCSLENSAAGFVAAIRHALTASPNHG